MIFFQFLLCFFFVIFFSKIIFIDFFLILSWLEFNFIIKFNHVGESIVTLLIKHCGLLQCLSAWFFLLYFFSNYLFQFYFFNIELFVNYNYKSLQIRLNHVRKYCSFHHKTLWIATVFPIWFFFGVCFVIFFSKIVSVDFFLILSWLRI
jgi:hypothetical protein